MQAPEITDIHAYLKQHEQKELLRFLTCGSVDDGKSTLIGRLLYDSKMVYEDQLAAVKDASKKHGTTSLKDEGSDFDPALLTDGLKAEREQGITIDVAYRYFSTTARKFIIADTPGHEQYTRNMATGASNCQLAIILIDARHGVQTQTRRHSFIASLLGIRHVVVAVNKMDLVDWSEDRYREIKADYRAFIANPTQPLDLPDLHFVPMSALLGDNVVNPSEHMPWHRGGTLMHLLETVHIASDRNLANFRFPVQYVTRPDLNFRGFAGTLASGTVAVGDDITVLPSRKTSRVKSIVTYDGDLPRAQAGMAPTITLEDEVDVSRGDMLVHPDDLPEVGQAFEAHLVWMDEQPLKLGAAGAGRYTLKHTTTTAPAQVSALRHRIDVNTLAHDADADTLELNGIGRVVVELARPLAFDPYPKNRGTGAFILIDRQTHNTVGAGMILGRTDAARQTALSRIAAGFAGAADTDRTRSLVPADERAQRLGQKPVCVWLTGLTGSGKSTLLHALERRLFDEGRTTFVLDGRSARLGLSSDLTFSARDRAENLRRAAEIAKLTTDQGLITLCSFLSPTAADRDTVRDIIGADRFLEVYIQADAETAKARAAERADADFAMNAFSDLAADYKPPSDPALTLNTTDQDVQTCLDALMALLSDRGVIGG